MPALKFIGSLERGLNSSEVVEIRSQNLSTGSYSIAAIEGLGKKT